MPLFLIIWGSRGINWHPVADADEPCGHCGSHQATVLRSYRVGHLYYLFSLFAFAHRYAIQCDACGNVGDWYEPPNARPVPFYHRFGWLLFFGIPFALVFLFVLVSGVVGVVGAAASGGSDSSYASYAEGDIVSLVDLEVAAPGSHGPNTEVARLASDAAYDAAATAGVEAPEVNAYAGGSHPTFVVVTIQDLGLRGRIGHERDAMGEQVWTRVAERLQPGDRLVIGVRGILRYGIIAEGTVGGAPRLSIAESLDAEPLRAALAQARTASANEVVPDASTWRAQAADPQVLARVVALADQLAEPAEEVTEATVLSSVLDELALVELTLALEEEFGLAILDEVTSMWRTVDDAARYVTYMRSRTAT